MGSVFTFNNLGQSETPVNCHDGCDDLDCSLILKEENYSDIEDLLGDISEEMDDASLVPTRLPSLNLEERNKYGVPRKGSIEWRLPASRAVYTLFKCDSPKWTVLTLKQEKTVVSPPGSNGLTSSDVACPPALPLQYPLRMVSPLEALRSSPDVGSPPASPCVKDITNQIILKHHQVSTPKTNHHAFCAE